MNDVLKTIITHWRANIKSWYVEKVKPIFKECFRVLKKGGVLLCGLDNGINAGFVLTNLYEDTNGEGKLHEYHIPSFMATRAIKP